MKRYGMVLRLKPEKVAEYVALHHVVWPAVLERISRSNLRNYSIFLKELDDGRHYLFGYFEYVGGDYEADMRAIADDPMTQKWWRLTEPCQDPIATRTKGEWWAEMEEVFHLD